MKHAVRTPAVAGLFYPEDAHELRTLIRSLLAAVTPAPPVPKAIIAPHAGYIYSGPIAASVYARLIPARASIRRVVLLGPSHRVAFEGIAVSGAGVFTTPLGNIPVDTAATEQLLALPQVHILGQAHRDEHSLEVQLPFLQAVLADFTLVPLVVGDASPEQVSEVIEAVWGGTETLIVISSDLSHYQDYATARRIDAATSRAIEELRPQDIRYEHACGRIPVNGLLLSARKHGLQARTLDLRNSGDTAGTRDRVVGYGAYVFN
jgi:MEMO1 family protein